MWPSYTRVQFIKPQSIFVHKNIFHLDETEFSEIQHLCEKAKPIFNPDKKRLQYDLKKKSKIYQKIATFLSNNSFLHQHEIGGIVILHSKKGCQQQRWHMDYDPQTLYNLNIKPRGLLISLQDNTKFVTSLKNYVLDKGDVLSFSGDVIHAGAHYDEENIRIHIYLDIPDVKRKKNTTWFLS